MQLYFIRHGQSANNLLYERNGHEQGRSCDPELTEYGQQQAGHVAAFLANSHNRVAATRDAIRQNISGFQLTHLYVSPMLRAIQTAAVIASICQITPVVHLDIYETGGIWLEDPQTGEHRGQGGATRSYFKTHFPNFVLPDDVREDGWWNRPEESLEECYLRGQRFLEWLKQTHGNTEDQVAVVSHGMFYNIFVSRLLGISLDTGLRFFVNNTAVNRIDFDPDRTRFVYQNRVDFLPYQIIT